MLFQGFEDRDSRVAAITSPGHEGPSTVPFPGFSACEYTVCENSCLAVLGVIRVWMWNPESRDRMAKIEKKIK